MKSTEAARSSLAVGARSCCAREIRVPERAQRDSVGPALPSRQSVATADAAGPNVAPRGPAPGAGPALPSKFTRPDAPGTSNLLGYLCRSLWLWVLAGFVFVAVLWIAAFKVAHSAQIREVPLATKGGKP